MLKRGEADVAYSLRGAFADEVKRTAGLRLAPTLLPATFWVDFTAEQWKPKLALARSARATGREPCN